MTVRSAASLISRARYLLLDFDGPVCAVFAGVPAPEVAARLRRRLNDHGLALPAEVASEDDPLEVFRITAAANGDHVDLAHQLLTQLEVEAIESAKPTPHAAELLAGASARGRSVAIVSNNSAMSIRAYLRAHHVSDYVTLIAGRVADPSRMKPDPFLVHEAITGLSEVAERGVMIGDSVSDIQAAHAAGVPAIGYANRPVKEPQLANAGADAITTSIADLVTQLTGETDGLVLALRASVVGLLLNRVRSEEENTSARAFLPLHDPFAHRPTTERDSVTYTRPEH